MGASRARAAGNETRTVFIKSLGIHADRGRGNARRECTTTRVNPAPREQGIYRSQRKPCPGCGKPVTVHPNGRLPLHRVP